MTQDTTLLASAFLLLFVAVMFVYMAQVRAGKTPHFRRIRAFDALKSFSSRAIEAGRPLHLTMGSGSMANQSTADSLAGLSVLEHLAKQSAVTRIPPTVTMANPTVMLFAQNTLRSAYKENNNTDTGASKNVRYVAPQPSAYAAGVMSMLNADKPEATAMVGQFGDEYLLMGETAALRGVSQVAGASNPNTLPFIYVSADESLLGEEMYAAGAYLQKHPSHIGSLLAQDTMRWVIGLIILGGVLIASLG